MLDGGDARGFGEDDATRDDLDGDLDAPARPPSHPDDRLWRHPSEVASTGLPSAWDDPDGVDPDAWTYPLEPRADSHLRSASRSHRGPHRRRADRWVPIVLAGAVGALLSSGVLAVTGELRPGRGGLAPSTSSTLALAVRTDTALPSLADMAERLRASMVAVAAVGPDGRMSRGSAVAIQASHHLITSMDVVDGATTVMVATAAGNRRASVVGADSDSNLALLRVDDVLFTPAPWGSSTGMRPGDQIIAVSAPAAPALGPTVSAGVVAGLGRSMDDVRGLLQVDRPVPAEGAGGALVDSSGMVVGMTLPAPIGGATYCYAVPAEVVEDVSRQILAVGRVAHAWLGVEGIDRTSGGMPAGAVVERVRPGSPAARAGLKEGDVITAMNGQPILSMSALLTMLRSLRPGSSVHLTTLRGSTATELLATLVDRP